MQVSAARLPRSSGVLTTLYPPENIFYVTPSDFEAASEATLQTIILSRLKVIANLRKDVTGLNMRIVEQLADIRVAEMLLKKSRKR